METFRSEFSEDGGPSTSRFGGSSSSAASLSFVSRAGSFYARSARSDFLSSYELKFQARKAEKEKKKKKEREAAASNQASSAEDKWRAEREADRAVRRRERDTWLPAPAALKRVERDSRKRSRERMQRVLSWYPSSGGSTEEVHPHFAVGQSPAAAGATLERVLTDQERIAEDEARRAMASGLQRRVDDLRLKVTFVECQARLSPCESPVRAKRNAMRHRRAGREQLAPLGDGLDEDVGAPATGAIARSASHSSLGSRQPTTESGCRALRSCATANPTSGSHRRLGAGLSGSKSTSHLAAVGEDDDEADEAEMEQFLLLHRRQRKQHYYATKIQATWRMYKQRRVYSRWGRRRLRLRRKVFQVWALAHRFKAQARRGVKRRYLRAWRDEVGVAIQLREIELKLFRDAEMQAELPKLVMNLVFTSSEHDHPGAARRVSRQASLLGTGVGAGFFNSAFAGVEQFPDSKTRRVQHTRVLHREARRAVVKKIVQRTFLLWKRVHAENKRVGLNAQLCIKRAARLAFGSRPVWAGERLLLLFGIWSRWAAFSRCKRSGLPLPVFAHALPQWDVWVFNHQERHVRKVKAAAKAPVARMHRYFHRLRRYSRASVRKKAQARAAAAHFAETATRKVLRAWRAEIAEAARNKKRCRDVLARLRRYAHVKAALRPRRQAVARRTQLWDFGRAWRAWKGVHLRSFFKRELNVSKLEQSAWRSKVHRIVYVWMGAKHEVNRWRTFEAWRNLCRKRRLFRTLRFQCERVRKRYLLFGVLNAWKAFVWKQADEFLEDRLKLSAWDAYEELSPFFPKLFYGCYSAAAAIFGGVEIESEDGAARDRARLRYDADGIRRFQNIVSQGSVAEVRNAVLQAKHLVNAVDDASGNTPLHIAMQVEDPTHRCDVLALLLSEGAATWHHANRHGLTPEQLAPTADAKLLLESGVYAFYADKVLQQRSLADGDADDQRLVWCMVTLMSSEWVRGDRLAGDVKVREWHSVLKDELWLRQERIIFASTSGFSPAILRCRAFLNGMKKKLARSCEQLLQPPPPPPPTGASTASGCLQRQDSVASLPVRQTLSRALHARGSLRGQQHVGMIARVVDVSDRQHHQRATTAEEARKARARRLGDLEAYARFLLTPTLDCDLAERDLVHSFVGVLFSLGFPLDEVLAEAYRLEDACAALEQRVLSLHDALVRAQWRVPCVAAMSPDPALLCCFATELDMELFFEKELLYLRVAALALERDGGDGARDDGEGGAEATATSEASEALAKELASLVTKLQRKMRKVEKKKKAVEHRIADATAAYRATLFAAVRSVRTICDARVALEAARLRLAGVLLKHSELQAEISAAEKLKTRVASGEALGGLLVHVSGADSVDAIQRRSECLEVERVKCRPPYRTTELLVASEGGAEGSASDLSGVGCLDVRRLHRDAKTALRQLFVANLFRCCCCWLAENMLPPPPDDDALNDLEETRLRLAAASPSKALRARQPPPATSRRRSSVNNSRKLVDTLHRASALTETAERDAALMHASYASSVDLLFEAERAELQEAARRKQAELQCQVVEVVFERNPITGLPEDPPEHLVDVRALQQQPTDENAGERRAEPRRHRKKEELRKAVVEHQLRRVAAGDRHLSRTSSNLVDASLAAGDGDAQLPAVHGSAVAFGNFVMCASPPHAVAVLAESPPARSTELSELSERAVEHMWKRGLRATDGGGAQAAVAGGKGAGSSESDADASTSFRVLSASRDHRAPSVRLGSVSKVLRPSDVRGPAGGDSRSGSARATAADRQAAAAATRAAAAAATGADQEAASDGVFVPPPVDERESDAGGGSESAANGADAPEPSPGDEEDDEEEGGGADPERRDSVDTSDDDDDDDDHDHDAADATPSLAADPRPTTDTSADDATLNALDDHLLRLRVAAEEERGAPAHATPLLSERSSPRDAQQQPELCDCDDGGGDDDEGDAGDAFAAGSRFLSFIRWEKTPKDAAALPRIFQDAPPRSLYAPQERDVRHAAKRKADAAASAPATRASPRASRSAVCDPSALALRGTAAVLAASRTRTAVSSGDGPALVSASEAAPGDVDDADVLAAIPRISVIVVPAGASDAPPAEERAPAADAPPAALEDARAPLQLAGRAFASLGRPPSDAASAAPTAAKKAPPPTTTRAALARQHSDAALLLEGTRTGGVRAGGGMTQSQSTGDVKAREAAPKLSAQQKQQVWDAFAALPLSDGVQNAYAVLYPHLYAPTGEQRTAAAAAADPHETAGDPSTPPALQLRALRDPRHSPSSTLQLDRRFWSAVEGFRAIGAPTSVLPLDAAAVASRRRESARRIHAEFLHERGVARLAWLDMYPRELLAVASGLRAAPPSLFDALQQTAQLRISTALSRLRAAREGGE